MRATNDGKSNCASLFSLGDLLGCAGCGLAPSSCASELFCVGEDEVHVLRLMLGRPSRRGLATYLVECEHLPDHLSAILQSNFHAVVDLVL